MTTAGPKAAPAAEPAPPKRSLFRGASWIGGYTSLFMLIRLVRGAVIPKLLTPAAYGLWSSIVVVMRYLLFCDFGVLDQYSKRYPRLMGEGRQEDARVLEAKTMGTEGGAALLVGLGLVAAAVLYRGAEREFYFAALLLMAAAFVFQRARMAIATALVVRERFREQSLAYTTMSTTDMVIAITLVWLLGAVGLPAGVLAGEVIAVTLLLLFFRPPRPQLPDRAFIGAFKEGLLLLALQFSGELLYTTDRMVLVFMADKHELGLYSLSMFGISLLLAPSGVFLAVLQPRVLRLTGQGKLAEARELMEGGLSLYLLITTAVVLVGLAGFDVLLGHYFRDYAAGRIAAFILFSLALGRGPAIILRVHYLASNRERSLIAFQAIFGVILFGLAAAALKLGHGIEGVAAATVVAQLSCLVLMWIDYERHSVGGYVGYSKFVIKVGGLLLYAGTAYTLATRTPAAGLLADIWSVLASVGAALALLGVACLLARRWIMALARPFFRQG